MGKVELAHFIKLSLKDAGLTQKEAARRAGISRQSLIKIINGEVSQVKLLTLIKLANVLNVHALHLLRKFFEDVPIYKDHPSLYPRDFSGFVRDITIPDDSMVGPGEEFEKIWEIQNLGDTAWERRRLVCADTYFNAGASGPNIPVTLGALTPLSSEVPIATTKPGGKVQVAVRLRAPKYPCSTISYWKMVDHNNEFCFPELLGLYCRVIVVKI